jgi:hypothetical protein
LFGFGRVASVIAAGGWTEFNQLFEGGPCFEVNDTVNPFNRMPEAAVFSHISQRKIRIETADLAVIARLVNHQPWSATSERKLARYLIANKTRSPGDQQFFFLALVVIAVHSLTKCLGISINIWKYIVFLWSSTLASHMALVK